MFMNGPLAKGITPPGDGEAVVKIGGGAEAVRRLFVIETVQPGKSTRAPACRRIACLNERWGPFW